MDHGRRDPLTLGRAHAHPDARCDDHGDQSANHSGFHGSHHQGREVGPHQSHVWSSSITSAVNGIQRWSSEKNDCNLGGQELEVRSG